MSETNRGMVEVAVDLGVIVLEQQAETQRLWARLADVQFEAHHPYAHELRTRYPWLEDAVANARLLELEGNYDNRMFCMSTAVGGDNYSARIMPVV